MLPRISLHVPSYRKTILVPRVRRFFWSSGPLQIKPSDSGDENDRKLQARTYYLKTISTWQM